LGYVVLMIFLIQTNLLGE